MKTGNTSAPSLDLILRHGILVAPGGERRADLGLAGGRIVAMSPSLDKRARVEIDAAGLHVFPGLIDAHVHFNEPGRTEWEGIASGSRSLAAGGGTMFFDMPLNSSPPTLDVAAFECKAAAAREKSLVDFALWGGLVRGHLDQLEALHARGVIGFKAFMSRSGIDEFPRADHATLREGMKRVAKFDGLVGVHAESETMTQRLARSRIAAGRTSVRDYLDSRPVRAEVEAIREAIALAGETGCRLHIVHVSSGEGAAAVIEGRRRGVDVSCETCPHYLALIEDDVFRRGAAAKCAPPLRPRSSQDLLWKELLRGEIDTVGSDHSPAPPGLKTGDDFFKIWGGIAGVQHTLPLLLTEGTRRGVTLSQLAAMTSQNVAARFRLPEAKGRLAVGADADLTLVDPRQEFIVQREALLDRHRLSPYVGRKLRGRVVRTLVRGRTVFLDGRIVSPPGGRLIKPRAA